MHTIEGSELVSKRVTKHRFRRAIINTWDECCAYCGCKPNSITLDHVIPKVKGGTTQWSNLVPACTSCNGSKGHSDVWEWYQLQFFHCAAREQKVRDWLINEKPPPVGEGYGVNAGGDQAAGGSVPSGGFAASPVVSSS